MFAKLALIYIYCKISAFVGSVFFSEATGCLPNIFSQFQGFQGFFSQFFACFSRFFGNFFACFQGSSKKLHQISTYRFRNFRTNLNIRRFSETKMGDLSRFDNFSVINSHFKVFKVFH